MRDYLKEFCIMENIQLIYTNNKYSLLSFGIQGNIPTIRIHRMFRNCPQNMTNIIISYYRYFQWQHNYIRAIQNFAAKINPIYEANQYSMIKNTLQIKPNKSVVSTNQGHSVNSIQNKNLDEEKYISNESEETLWKLKRVDIELGENEEQDLNMILEPEDKAVIHGVVKFPNGNPVKGALVKLFKKGSGTYNLIPVTFTFTDEFGQFLFGVEAEIELVIKVFYYEEEDRLYNKNSNFVYYEG